jgi:hypothetical protein
VILKRRCGLAELDPAIFGSHSLRSGFLTSGAVSGSSIFKLLEVSRHKSIETLRGYVKRQDLFQDHAERASFEDTRPQAAIISGCCGKAASWSISTVHADRDLATVVLSENSSE